MALLDSRGIMKEGLKYTFSAVLVASEVAEEYKYKDEK
jgi:hypothetical protein